MTREHLQFRHAHKEDCDIILDLLLELSKATGLPGKVISNRQGIEDALFSENSFVHAVVAVAELKPVGLCLYYPIYSSWRGESGVYILDLYVNSNVRGQGFGRQMISFVAEDAHRKWQANFMHLDVDKENSSGFSFYQKLGFEHSQEDDKMVALSSIYATFFKNKK